MFLELWEMLIDCVVFFPLVPVLVCGGLPPVCLFFPLVVLAGAWVFEDQFRHGLT